MRSTIAVVGIMARAALLASVEPARADRIELVAGGEGSSAREAKVTSPFGVGFDATGTLYFVEMVGNRVRKLNADGLVITLAGSGRKGSRGDHGPAADAELNGPHSLALDATGDIFIADTSNNRVRKIDSNSGQITTVAGTGHKGFSGDGGQAVKADFGGIYCLTLDHANRTLDLADLDNRRVRRVDLKTGVVTTVAGNGKKGVPADGADARHAPLVDPRAVANDGRGNLYILDRGGNALRVVDRVGKIRTVVGIDTSGHSGDAGDASKATLNGPKHISVGHAGNVLIADTENHCIRMYRPRDGTIEVIAGTGQRGAKGLGGPPREAQLNQPHGVTEGPGSILYISDSSNNRILKIVP